MGLDYHFHLQHFNGSVWTTLPELDDATDHVMHGELTWFDDKDVTVLRLFIRDDALFPLHRELPPHFEIRELFRMSNRAAGMSDADVLGRSWSVFNEAYRGWIGFDELDVDSWFQTELLIKKTVQADIAWAFGTGDQRFPRSQLLNAGWTETDIEDLADTTHYARDREFDPNGYGITTAPVKHRDSLLQDAGCTKPVSWKVTVAEFIGEWRVQAFRRARQLASDRSLRVICTLS